MERILTCNECGKQFQGKYAGRAYAGHMWLAHFKRIGARGEIVALKQDISNLKSYIGKLESRCSNQQMQLEQATKPQVTQVMYGYEWDYCPKCGQPKGKHRRYRDLAYGEGWECPGGGRVKA